jgi:hypothetical protein
MKTPNLTDKDQQALKDIRKAYLLAKTAATMLEYIKHDISKELRTAALEAKAKNNYFVKLIDEAFIRHKVPKTFIDSEDELSFEFLETLYEPKVKMS